MTCTFSKKKMTPTPPASPPPRASQEPGCRDPTSKYLHTSAGQGGGHTDIQMALFCSFVTAQLALWNDLECAASLHKHYTPHNTQWEFNILHTSQFTYL